MRTTPEREARQATEHACFLECEKAGLIYHGFRVLTGDDLKVSLYVYGSQKKDPNKVSILRINDVATVRTAMDGGDRPEPRSMEAIQKSRDAAQKSIAKREEKTTQKKR